MNQNNQQAQAQKIRDRYEDRKPSEMDTLRELDARVKRPAAVFAYIFGSISAVVMGAGMSLVMTDIGSVMGLTEVIGLTDALIPGIAVGVAGMLLAAINYPIYKGILKSRKKKYSAEILRLSDSILKQK